MGITPLGETWRRVEEFHSQINAEPAAGRPPRTSLFHTLVDVLETVVFAIVLFVGINAVSTRIRVDGSSMEPTLHNNELVIVNKLAYKLTKPRLGDVIVFRKPSEPDEEYIKRVIGVAGDRIEVSQGQVFVNGQRLEEPYIAASPNYPGSWTVPAGALFVLGDNRNDSSDSHTWGPVPVKSVIGKAVFVYWPPEQWGVIAHTAQAAAGD